MTVNQQIQEVVEEIAQINVELDSLPPARTEEDYDDICQLNKDLGQARRYLRKLRTSR